MTNHHTQQSEKIYWTVLAPEHWGLHLAGSAKGLLYVGSPGQSDTELAQWAAVKCPGSPLVRDDRAMAPYARELTEYLEGRRGSFTVPHDLRGTAFQRAVWEALDRIPYGHTVTYSDIAREVGKPAAVRAVGAAIGANPVMIVVPCHRVIGKNGALTGFRGGLDMKTRLLELERTEQDRKPASRLGS